MWHTTVRARPSGLRQALGAMTRRRQRRAKRRDTWYLGDPVVPTLRGWPVEPPPRR